METASVWAGPASASVKLTPYGWKKTARKPVMHVREQRQALAPALAPPMVRNEKSIFLKKAYESTDHNVVNHVWSGFPLLSAVILFCQCSVCVCVCMCVCVCVSAHARFFFSYVPVLWFLPFASTQFWSIWVHLFHNFHYVSVSVTVNNIVRQSLRWTEHSYCCLMNGCLNCCCLSAHCSMAWNVLKSVMASVEIWDNLILYLAY